MRRYVQQIMDRGFLKTFLVTTALLVAGALAALPLAWSIWHSFTAAPLHAAVGQTAISFDAYRHLFSAQPVATWLANSLFLAGLQTVIAAICSTLAGFALARYRFRGRLLILGVFLATLLLPSQVALPAAWQLMRDLHLLDSYLALLLPAAASAFGVLLFYQTCRQIPPELLDAARIDGCGEWRLWWEIVLPAIQPTLATFVVLSFTANWNAFLWPQIVIQDDRKYTLAMGMANLTAQPQSRGDLPLLLAATTLCIIPSFILFLAARKHLNETFNEGAIRG